MHWSRLTKTLCGIDGIWTDKYIECDADLSYFATVPLVNVTREEALRRATFHGVDTFGVVPLRRGSWGIRVKAEHYEDAAKQIRPDDYQKIIGPVYELSGFPVYTTEEGLAEFLGEANPLLEVKGTRRYGWGRAQRRKFLVKTSVPVVWDCKQGKDFLVSCNVAPKRTSKPRQESKYTLRPSTKAVDFPSLLRTTPTRTTPPVVSTTPARGSQENLPQALPTGKRGASAMNTTDAAAMDTGVQREVFFQPTPPAPTPQGQEDLATTLQRLLAPMQQQLAQLAPMNQRLEKLAEGLENVTNKDREDSNYETYDGENVELNLLQDDDTRANSGTSGFVAGEANPKGRGRRATAGNAANILNKTIRKSRA